MPHIILPPGVRSVHRPPEPAFRCLLCGEEFTQAQAISYTDHVSRCVHDHAQEIQDARPSAKNAGTIYDPESWDPEYEAWVQNIGRKMLREGRLERKPNEC